MPEKDALREKLARQAETVLPPELAILIECAFESESVPAAREFLNSLMKRFNDCAEQSCPLRADGRAELYSREITGPRGAELLVGLIPERTLEREAVITSSAMPGDPEFEALVTDTALGLDVAPLAPLILGVGVASGEDEAAELARRALFRAADKLSADAVTANAERGILSRLNARGPGAGGLGGRHTALAVSVESSGHGYIALLPGDCFTGHACGEAV
ncbi:MAG: fumarate hydratase [Oscillospiraceae bacterium]|jgi:tartrate dehydratase alpha subunit/fumarate hydratase class I-like protein|nr:fumarate hydratase [Oscillospiraceae bacterium]